MTKDDPTRVPAEEQGLGDRLREHLFRDTAATLAATGGLLYGLIALAYDRFYRLLGLSPDSVGITPTEIVERTAIVLGLLVAAAIWVFAAIYFVLCLFLRKRSQATVALWAAAIATPVAVLVLIVTNHAVLWSDGSRGYTVKIGLTLMSASLGSLLVRHWVPATPRRRFLIGALWASAAGFAYINAVNGTTGRAAELANDVLAGEPIRPQGQTFMYDVRADPVCVTVEPSATGAQAPAYGLYLGEANGWVAVYDSVLGRTVRLSRTDVTLRLIPSSRWPYRVDQDGDRILLVGGLRSRCN